MAAPDLGGQVLSEDGQLCAVRRAHMRRKVLRSTVFAPLRSKQQ